MSATGLAVFNETVQLSNVWLNELMDELGSDNKQQTYRVLRATLHALRDRLTAHEAVQLGAQLPMLIRGIYYEGWRLQDAAPAERSKREFLDHVSAELKGGPTLHPEKAVQAVFKLLAHKIAPGEIDDIKKMLPAEVRALWPAVAQ